MSFQTQVNQQPAPAVAGDFASGNPRATVLATANGLICGTNGVTVGRFAWVSASDGATVANAGSGVPSGFVHNEHTGLITAYLAETSMLIPAGFPVTLFNGGDFFAKNDGSGAATVGQKVFASSTTGQVQTAAAGATVTGYVETKWYVASAGAAGELIKITSTPLT